MYSTNIHILYILIVLLFCFEITTKSKIVYCTKENLYGFRLGKVNIKIRIHYMTNKDFIPLPINNTFDDS